MIGGSLEPPLNTDGYAGYGCPNFKTKAACEKWIRQWNREHPGVWVEKKTWVTCNNESENVIYIKGINALGKKLIEVSNNKLISKWLKKTFSQLGVDYE
jgi:hypothetical protein